MPRNTVFAGVARLEPLVPSEPPWLLCAASTSNTVPPIARLKFTRVALRPASRLELRDLCEPKPKVEIP
jgi:hypothetical protein